MVKTNDAGPYMAKTNNADPGKINTYRKNPEAVIIYPALGCSGIAAPDLDFDIFVLLHSNIPDEKINKDFFDKKFYCSTWDNQKDSRSGQPLEVKEPPKKIALGNDYIIEDRLHLSEVFWKEFKTKGYTKIYKIRLKAPATGFYNIYYNQPQKLEDELLNSILNGRPHALDGDKDFASLFNTGSTLSIRVNPKGEQQQGQQVRRYAPLYVTPKKYISFGLVGDPHTALHWYEFERRWNEYRNSSKIPRNQRNNCEFGDRCNEKFCVCGVCDNDKNFCNYNKEFLEALGNIEKDGNVEAVVILGDLIDCNRGYKSGSNVKDINNYQADCNWLHFYALILDSMKQKPYYTVLGNHDYRFNPYQPMPYLIGERFSIASDLNITRQELCKIYDEEETVYESGGLEDGVGKRSSLHISAQSVHWYHLVMNPFTDYVVHHEKMSLCFLDWDKDEVNLPIDNPELQFSDNLPWAKNSLSELQIKLLKSFKENSPDENVRVLFSHAPIINPYPQIGYEYLKDGKITCGTCRGRGYYSQRTSEGPTVVECAVCKGTKFQNALPWHKFWENEWELTDGTFFRERNWLIRFVHVGPKRFNLVIGGHCHHFSIFQIFPQNGENVVKVMKWDKKEALNKRDDEKEVWNKGDKINPKMPVYVNAGLAGPMSFANENGISLGNSGKTQRYIASPGYSKVILDTSGNIASLEVVYNKIKPRFVADFDFKRGFNRRYHKRAQSNFQPESNANESVASSVANASTLAQKYAPIVWLAPDEIYRPIEVDRILKYAILQKYRWYWNTNIQKGNVTAAQMMQNNTAEHQLDISDAKKPPTVNELHKETAIYYRVAKAKKGGQEKYVIQYWFFYLDSIGEINLKNSWTQHDGDWEFMQVVLDATLHPESIGVSIHYYGEARPWANVNIIKEGELPWEKALEWECWIRQKSCAKRVKVDNGGIVGVYNNETDAKNELCIDQPWRNTDGEWECWLTKQPPPAKDAKMDKGGIIGVFANEADALVHSACALRPEIFVAKGGHGCHFVNGQIQTYASMEDRFIRNSEFGGNWSGTADDPTGWRGGRDNTGKGTRLEPAINRVPSSTAYKLIDITQVPWLEWKGHFGESDFWTWGPRSPYYRSPEKDKDNSPFSMWNYPLTWQKEFLKSEYNRN